MKSVKQSARQSAEPGAKPGTKPGTKPSTKCDPRALDVRSLCKSAEPLLGARALSEMPRLACSLAAASDAQVAWVAEGSLRPASGAPAQHWLHLQAKAQLPLQCQRCLAVMLQPVVVDRHFRFVVGEDQAAREDEASEEEVLALAPQLDLHALLEDELILALPIVPRHDKACPQPLSALAPAAAQAARGQPQWGGSDPPEPERPHPFASLAGLRGQLRNKN